MGREYGFVADAETLLRSFGKIVRYPAFSSLMGAMSCTLSGGAQINGAGASGGSFPAKVKGSGG
jgi:hypothetical protein